MSDPIPFKGRNISITAVLLQDVDTANIDEALSAKIAQVPAGFFTTQPLVADLSALEGFQADAKWLKTLKRIFERHSLCLVGISGGQIVEGAAVAAGLALVCSGETKSSKAKIPEEPLVSKTETSALIPPMLLRQNIRSGQSIIAKERDLVIIGTVSPGAELYADGNITVYGALRGRAFAGGQDNTAAYIYCYELGAELVSIAGFYQDMEQLQAGGVHRNAFISLNPDESMRIVSV
jgi:septum site-determining protein minC